MVSVLVQGRDRPHTTFSAKTPAKSATGSLPLHSHAMVHVAGDAALPRLDVTCPLLRQWVVLPNKACDRVDPSLAY